MRMHACTYVSVCDCASLCATDLDEIYAINGKSFVEALDWGDLRREFAASLRRRSWQNVSEYFGRRGLEPSVDLNSACDQLRRVGARCDCE